MKFHSIAPGRVNLLGEHLDYNDGPVMPAAIDRSVRLDFSPREDGLVNLEATDLDEQISFRIDDLELKLDIHGQPLPTWARYPAGVAWSMRKADIAICGLDGKFTSDIPMGSGLSSSAAVELAFAVAWNHFAPQKNVALRLAQLCQRAENQYVGVNCGLMDQFASACGVEGHALIFDTRTLAWQPLPLPAGTSIVVADSTMRRSLTTSVYNNRRAACERAVQILKKYLPEIQALRDVTPDDFEKYADKLPEDEFKRAHHVVYECDRVFKAKELLRTGKAEEFGRMMYECHDSLRDFYEVSIPELNALVEIAATLPGCLGARLTGAGFGGCTVNLVKDENVEEFENRLKTGYLLWTGKNAQVYLCHASQGARILKTT